MKDRRGYPAAGTCINFPTCTTYDVRVRTTSTCTVVYDHMSTYIACICIVVVAVVVFTSNRSFYLTSAAVPPVSVLPDSSYSRDKQITTSYC